LEQKRKPKLARIIFPVIIICIFATSFYYYSKSKVENKASGAQNLESSSSISSTPTEIKPAEEQKVTFAFGGDLMFDRNVWHRYKDIGLNHIFDNLDTSIFKNSDIAFANLEGPISATPINDDYASGSMIFNFPPETVDTLKYLGLNGVSLANNHSMNAGASGFANTKNVLAAADINFAGSQNNFDESNILRLKTKVPITIIAVDMLVSPENDQILSKIGTEVSAGQKVIVFPHWGVEYQAKHNSTQENLAKSWIDAGAIMVIGGHPHVVEDAQIYKGRPIIYSLGNFVFDQFFSPETQQGLLLTGTITKDNLTVTFLPFTDNNVKPKLDSGSIKSSRLNAIFPTDGSFDPFKTSEDTIKLDLTKT
jgi:poly-gamma-glutamate synthesis protein (capsule biosynthesis protein)